MSQDAATIKLAVWSVRMGAGPGTSCSTSGWSGWKVTKGKVGQVGQQVGLMGQEGLAGINLTFPKDADVDEVVAADGDGDRSDGCVIPSVWPF